MFNFNKQNLKKYGLIATGVIAVFGLGTWGVCALRAKLAIRAAEAMLQKGYGSVAADDIDKYRYSVINYDRGCPVLLAAYYSSRRLERLEWASEACLNAGKDIPEAYLALAAHREFTGRDNDALRILNSVAQKFDKIPDIYYRMSQILNRNKNVEGATQLVLKAVERIPTPNQMTVEALEFLTGAQKWNEARMVADKLKGATTEDPELKLLIARALKNGGDVPGAQALIDQAKGMLATKPEIKAALERTYGELLSDKGRVNPPMPASGTPPGMPPGMPPNMPNMAGGMPPGGMPPGGFVPPMPSPVKPAAAKKPAPAKQKAH